MGLFNFVKSILPTIDDIKNSIFNNDDSVVQPTGIANTTPAGFTTPKPSTSMEFKVGENLTASQKKIAESKIAVSPKTEPKKKSVTNLRDIEQKKPSLEFKDTRGSVEKSNLAKAYEKKIIDYSVPISESQKSKTTPSMILDVGVEENVPIKQQDTLYDKVFVRGGYDDIKLADRVQGYLDKGYDKKIALEKANKDRDTEFYSSMVDVGGVKSVGKKVLEKAIKNIAKSKNPINIARNLLKIGIEDRQLAETLVGATDNVSVMNNIISRELRLKEFDRKIVDQKFRSDKLNLPEELTQEVEKRLSVLGLEKRTVKTFEEMNNAALELGADPRQLLKDVVNSRITDDEVIALRNTINANSQFIKNSVDQIKNNPEMEEILQGQIDNAMKQNDVALSKLVKGGTEAGRAVAAYKVMAQNTLDPIFWMTRAKRELGSKDLTGEMQRAIFDLTSNKDINGLASFVAGLKQSNNTEKLLTLWKAGLLTSPTTHIANTTGNITMRLLMDASDVVAMPIDVVASLITNKRTHNLPSIAAEAKGAFNGIKEVGRYMRTGIYNDKFLQKWDLPRQVNFDNKILDGYTKAIFRSLGAEDIVFRQMAMEKSFESQAKLIAKNEGLAGDIAKNRIKDLLQKPTNEMVLNAIDTAEYATFQSKNTLGDAIVGAKRALAKNDGLASKAGLVGLEIVAPFTKTPSNVISRIVDFSPAGFLKAAIRAANPATRSQKNIIDDLSRAVTGSGVMFLGYLLAEKGLITGGASEDEKERSTMYYSSQPNSILINGEWRELNRVSPLGNLMTLGADFYRLYQTKKGADLVASTAFSALKNLTNQSYLRGVAGGLEALTEPDRSGEKFVKQTVSSLVPTVVTRIAKSIDPTLRETDDIVDAFQERLPVLREKLAPKRDIFGEIVDVPAGSNYWFDPFSSKIDKSDDPVIKELKSLEHYIGMPEKIVDGVEMNSYEYSEYQRYNGKLLKPVLTSIVESEEYKSLNAEERKDIIDESITTIRKGVNDSVFPALMIVRFGLPNDTDPEILREVLRQAKNVVPGWNKKNDSQKASAIKKIIFSLESNDQ